MSGVKLVELMVAFKHVASTSGTSNRSPRLPSPSFSELGRKLLANCAQSPFHSGTSQFDPILSAESEQAEYASAAWLGTAMMVNSDSTTRKRRRCDVDMGAVPSFARVRRVFSVLRPLPDAVAGGESRSRYLLGLVPRTKALTRRPSEAFSSANPVWAVALPQHSLAARSCGS